MLIQTKSEDCTQKYCIIVGDFNSYSLNWGYEDLDTRGEEVEEWQVINNLQLLIDKDDEPIFYSRAWKTISMPDLTFAINNILRKANRQVLAPLTTNDNKPIAITVTTITSPNIHTLPRWKLKKADWYRFRSLTNQLMVEINCQTSQVDKSLREITRAIIKAARKVFQEGHDHTMSLTGQKG
ncbi:hypothetical protein PoB_005849800 [Plakobranchus ocellatus]|uniref:Endonuclease/exonuclease/phosphatase domain-containing protein n=1 Tax=Plakobranchus ocellatus TaxID=259542 RepID=A0AAV4CLE1_9GAST|nr:hypothetical protein PoB_005849800 [Plakobranchus ocellatus]